MVWQPSMWLGMHGGHMHDISRDPGVELTGFDILEYFWVAFGMALAFAYQFSIAMVHGFSALGGVRNVHTGCMDKYSKIETQTHHMPCQP